ncbi:MAG: biotin--[acetyl-CoA-carboxylase] ligase [Succinivibrio sp.]|nr:biotin--[acetyl-CoA-carboxylase] ligase [Succinivibrio sp.]
MGATLNGCLKLLTLLNEAPERILSLQELCASLARSRETLLEQVKLLNTYDYILEDLGKDQLYLNRSLDFYDEDYIFRASKGKGRVSVLESIGSTNTEMLTRHASLASGDVILAEIQYGSRSRRNTKWHCPIGSQLTMSLCTLYEPTLDIAGLSVAVGVRLAAVLTELGVEEVKVKWPNDLYVQGRKICGILVETISNLHSLYIVTGLGLNVHKEGFEELETPHISLDEAQVKLSRNEVAVAVISALRELFEQFQRSGFVPYQADFDQWDYLKDRQIAVKTESSLFQGRACGIDEKGALLLQTAKGLEHLTSGHIL